MLIPGLVSISFRKKTPGEIISLCVRAGLRAVEWGGDVHVPAGDVSRAREVLSRTRDAGLSVCSYGSYYRLGQPDGEFMRALDCASAIETPVMRVWAGAKGSREASPDERSAWTEQLNRLSEAAGARGVTLALEYHAGTLTDSREGAQALLRETQACRFYWQPRWDWREEERLASLEDVKSRLSHLHVFTWTGAGERLPLQAGEAMWRKVFSQVHGTRGALLEFVRGDSDEQLLSDAACLKRMIEEAGQA